MGNANNDTIIIVVVLTEKLTESIPNNANPIKYIRLMSLNLKQLKIEAPFEFSTASQFVVSFAVQILSKAFD